MARNYDGRRNLRILCPVHELPQAPVLSPRDIRHLVLEGVKSKENVSSEEADMMQINAFLFMFQQWTIYLYPKSRVI